MKRRITKIIALLLIVVVSCIFILTACNPANNHGAGDLNSNENKVESGETNSENKNPSNSNVEKDDPSSTQPEKPPVMDPPVIPDESSGIEIVLPKNATRNTLSYTFASISIDLMSYGYDVFNAYVQTESGKEYGIAYTDYEDGYQFGDDNKTYISSGFLAYSAKENVSDSNEILVATPIDSMATEIEDDTYGYIVTCVEDGIPSGHFIADHLYTVYSVNEGKVIIKTYENIPKNYDLSLGILFDYDIQEVAFIPYDEIDSSPVEYVPLTEDIDYETIKNNLYRIIEEQQANGYKVQTITISFLSVDVLNALYGLLAQENSLNGYTFEELNGIEFDSAKQYIHFNEDGSITLKDLPPIPVTQSKNLLDWLVDALVLIGAGAIAIVSITFLGPAGGVIAAGVLGAGIEYFSQTVIGGKKFSEVNWAKVGIMAISGALGAMIPCAGALGYIAAGAVGGLTSAALTAVDGGNWNDVLTSAATGALTSMLMHGLFSSCFPAGTQVLTKEGYLPIELVTIGTLVASYNVYANKMEWNPVLETYTSTATTLTRITLSNGESILSTPNHPYYILSENRYVLAENLSHGDILLSTYEELYVTSVENIVLDSSTVVYNLNVDSNHNYYVDSSTILVHNACGNYKKATRTKDGINLENSISKKEALARLRNGQDVYCSSKKAAKALVKDAFGNAKPYAEIHPYINNATWHFHDAFNHIFHVFFN